MKLSAVYCLCCWLLLLVSHILAATKRRQPVGRDPHDDWGPDDDYNERMGDYHGPKRTPQQQAEFKAELRRKKKKKWRKIWLEDGRYSGSSEEDKREEARPTKRKKG